MALLLVLTVAAATVVTSMYLYISRTEQNRTDQLRKEQTQFQAQFWEDTNKVVEAIGSNLDKTLRLLDSVAVTLVAIVGISIQIWPYVTIPDFALRMSK